MANNALKGTDIVGDLSVSGDVTAENLVSGSDSASVARHIVNCDAAGIAAVEFQKESVVRARIEFDAATGALVVNEYNASGVLTGAAQYLHRSALEAGFTPTITNVANVANTAVAGWAWERNGDSVTQHGRITITPSGAGTTTVKIPLGTTRDITSFSGSAAARGFARPANALGQPEAVLYSTTGENTYTLSFTAPDATARTYSCVMFYNNRANF